MSPEMINGCLVLQPLCISPSHSCKLVVTSFQSHLIVRLDGSEFHHQLEAQQVVGANRLQLQQFAQSHQLGALQVLQRQLVLKQLGEADNVLRLGLLSCAPNLKWKVTDALL